MGRKEKTSHGRHGESFWEEEKNGFGFKMMERMGWQRGSGLGKQGQGTTQFIRSSKRRDGAGIGSKNTRADDTWIAATGVFNSVLAKLNAAGGDHVADPVAKEAAEAEGGGMSSHARMESYMAGRRLYNKFRKAKDTSGYSAKDMAAILGRRTDQPAKGADSKSDDDDEEEGDDGNPNKLVTIKSSSSIADYFAKKSGAKPASKKVTKFQAASGSGFSMDQQADYYDSMMQRSVSGRVGLGFGGAGTAPVAQAAAAPAAPAAAPAAPASDSDSDSDDAKKKKEKKKKQQKKEAKRAAKKAAKLEAKREAKRAAKLEAKRAAKRRAREAGEGGAADEGGKRKKRKK